MMEDPLRGPARYLSEHPALLIVSELGAGGAAGAFVVRSLRSRGPARLGWSTLAALELGILAGLLTLPRRRRPEP